jgi:hypothetical protein
MEKLFKCFSEKVKGYLENNGFESINERPDLKNPNKDIWLFVNSDELQEKFQEYKKLYGNRNFIK